MPNVCLTVSNAVLRRWSRFSLLVVVLFANLLTGREKALNHANFEIIGNDFVIDCLKMLS
jgi:hypothetical protein